MYLRHRIRTACIATALTPRLVRSASPWSAAHSRALKNTNRNRSQSSSRAAMASITQEKERQTNWINCHMFSCPLTGLARAARAQCTLLPPAFRARLSCAAKMKAATPLHLLGVAVSVVIYQPSSSVRRRYMYVGPSGGCRRGSTAGCA